MVIVYAALIACLIFAHLLIYCLVKSGIAESKKPAPLSARQRRLFPGLKPLQLCSARNKEAISRCLSDSKELVQASLRHFLSTASVVLCRRLTEAWPQFFQDTVLRTGPI